VQHFDFFSGSYFFVSFLSFLEVFSGVLEFLAFLGDFEEVCDDFFDELADLFF